MTKYGYQRISTEKQVLERQEQQLLGCGILKENIYTDIESGKKDDRKEFKKLLSLLEEGDSLTVVEFSRASRSIKTLIELADNLNTKGVDFISLKENVNTTTPEGRLFYNIIASFAQFERELLVARTKQGLEAAKRKGRVGGRPKVNKESVEAAISLYQTDTMSIKQIVTTTGISKATLYRELDKRGITRNSQK